MRVLLVTYYFPPAGGGGVQRVLSWCRHLHDLGAEVTVLAPQEPHWIQHDTTLVIPSSTRMIRTADPSPAAVIPKEQLAQHKGLSKIMQRLTLQPRRFAIPDIHRRWKDPALSAAFTEAKDRYEQGEPPWDVILSSSPPETVHLIAQEASLMLGIPWVADLRDSWLDLPHIRMDKLAVRFKHRCNVRLATRIMRSASAATTVSHPLANDLKKRHQHLEITVIENGIESDDVARAHARADGFRDEGKFVVAYTGNFFGKQTAAPFLAGLELALAQKPELKADLRLKFIGGLKPVELERALNLSVVEHTPFLRHDDVLATQRAADLLLLYVAPGRGSEGVYTGKVFEYVAARRPVLAIAPHKNVVCDLLTQSGSTTHGGGAHIPDESPEQIARALITAWTIWKTSSQDALARRCPDIDVPVDILDSIERSVGAKRLFDVLKRVVDQHAKSE